MHQHICQLQNDPIAISGTSVYSQVSIAPNLRESQNHETLPQSHNAFASLTKLMRQLQAKIDNSGVHIET